MPRYRIHYLKESQRQHFRNAPPVTGPLKIKLKDYQEGGEIEAASPYAAWKQIQATQDRRPIEVGDAVETDAGALYLCRWAGFEEAHWHLPEGPATLTVANEQADSVSGG
jgi:hypothetical protein